MHTTTHQSNYHFTSGGNLVEKNDLQMGYLGDQVCQGTRNGKNVFSASYNQGLMQEITTEGDIKHLQWDRMRRPIGIGKEAFVYLNGEAPLLQCHQDGSKTIWITSDYCVHINNQGKENFSQSIQGNGVVVFSSVSSTDEEEHIHYYHSDRQSSTHNISDTSGEKFIPVQFDRYGHWQTKQPTLKHCPGVRFTSMRFDSSLKLWRSHSRLFSPLLGRYIQSDSQPGGRVGMTDIFNGYAYTLNNPANFIDPSGHRVNDDLFNWQLGITVALGVLTFLGGGILLKTGVQSAYGMQATTGFASAFINSLSIFAANKHISPSNDPKMISYTASLLLSFAAGWAGARGYLTRGLNQSDGSFLVNAIIKNKYPILVGAIMPIVSMSSAIDAKIKHDFFPDKPMESNDSTTTINIQQQKIQTNDSSLNVSINYLNRFPKSDVFGSMNSIGLNNLMQHEELNQELILN